MSEHEEILNHTLSELRFSPDGRSVQLFLTDSVPPYGTVILSCDDLLAFHFHRTADDAVPYFLGEVSWQAFSAASQAPALASLGYTFFNERGGLLEPNWERLSHLHFEGSVRGDIVCRTCSVVEEERRTTGNDTRRGEAQPDTARVAGLHLGAFQIAPDFVDSLPDEFRGEQL